MEISPPWSASTTAHLSIERISVASATPRNEFRPLSLPPKRYCPANGIVTLGCKTETNFEYLSKKAAFVLSCGLTALATSCSGQWLDYPSPGIPRTPDGKPNLSAPTPRTPQTGCARASRTLNCLRGDENGTEGPGEDRYWRLRCGRYQFLRSSPRVKEKCADTWQKSFCHLK